MRKVNGTLSLYIPLVDDNHTVVVCVFFNVSLELLNLHVVTRWVRWVHNARDRSLRKGRKGPMLDE